MIYAACILGGMVVGFLVASRLFYAMKEDFFRAFGASPKGE